MLQHSYEQDGFEKTKFIGVYSSSGEARLAIERLRTKPGFRDHPDDFITEAYELDKDHWESGFSTMTVIMVKDGNGRCEAVSAVCMPGETYRLTGCDFSGDFREGDVVKCELRDGELYAVEKVIPGENDAV